MLNRPGNRPSKLQTRDRVRLIGGCGHSVGVVSSAIANPDRVYVEWPVVKGLLPYSPCELEIVSKHNEQRDELEAA
jgi:hypothetical protein